MRSLNGYVKDQKIQILNSKLQEMFHISKENLKKLIQLYLIVKWLNFMKLSMDLYIGLRNESKLSGFCILVKDLIYVQMALIIESDVHS